ncbi:MAG: Hsp20/alpha crystallin family protein [Bacteroidota bacterium]
MKTLARLANNPISAVPSFMEKFLDDDIMKWGTGRNYSTPYVNVKENKDEYTIELAAPGMKKDDFKINYEKEQLCISINKEEDKKDKEEKYLRREFSYQSFQRTFHVPQKLVDADKIKASYEKGILYISVPKKEEAKPKPAKKIKIS